MHIKAYSFKWTHQWTTLVLFKIEARVRICPNLDLIQFCFLGKGTNKQIFTLNCQEEVTPLSDGREMCELVDLPILRYLLVITLGTFVFSQHRLEYGYLPFGYGARLYTWSVLISIQQWKSISLRKHMLMRSHLRDINPPEETRQRRAFARIKGNKSLSKHQHL